MKKHGVSWMNGIPDPRTGKPLIPESWNPVTGCTAEFPCWARCWARKMAVTRMGHLGDHYARFAPTFHPDRLATPLRWRKPRAVFTGGQSDLFHEAFHDEQIAAVFGVMAASIGHLFIVPTKRPERAARWSTLLKENSPLGEAAEIASIISPLWELYQFKRRGIRIGEEPWPPNNVWLMTSVSNQEEADERIPHLLQVPAALHGVSLEPLLGPVDLRLHDRPGLCFVIAGGENGRDARPCQPYWVRSIRDQCVGAGVPFHFKGWGRHLPSLANILSTSQRGNLSALRHIPDGSESIFFQRMLDGRTWNEVPGHAP